MAHATPTCSRCSAPLSVEEGGAGLGLCQDCDGRQQRALDLELEQALRTAARVSRPAYLVLQRLLAARKLGGEITLRTRIGTASGEAHAAFPVPSEVRRG